MEEKQTLAEQMADEYKQDQEREFVLRGELRRLKEGDIKKLRDR